MGNVHTAGPNEAVVVSGGLCGDSERRMTIGGWAWAWWFVSDVQRLSLQVMTLNPSCESVETAKGVPLSVTGVAQIKPLTEEALLETACEQFLGRTQEDICFILQQTLDGHLRGILGTMTVEAVFQDRDAFATKVREMALPDMGRMGMEILSFTIKDVVDDVGYLDSLGKTKTAMVKRDADIGCAEAERDAGMREALNNKLALDVKYETDSKVANAEREYDMQQSNFDSEVNTAKAQAQLAHQLQSAKEQQRIRQEEIQIDVVERKKQIGIEEKEIERKEKELKATVKLPAEAEAYKVQALAEGYRTQVIEQARASAESTKLLGAAEAAAIEAVGVAEAEQMRARAAAYKAYGSAAMAQQILESLPKIAAEIAAPLRNVGEIVLVGGKGEASQVANLLASLPPSVQALTDVDLNSLFSKHFGAGDTSERTALLVGSRR